MSDGARCHYCRKNRCVCAQSDLKKQWETLSSFKIKCFVEIQDAERFMCGSVAVVVRERGIRESARLMGFSPAYVSDVCRARRNVTGAFMDRLIRKL